MVVIPAFPHLSDILIVFFVKVKCGAEPWPRSVINIRVEAQLSTSCAPPLQQYELRHLGSDVGVIEAMGNGLRNVVVLGESVLIRTRERS